MTTTAVIPPEILQSFNSKLLSMPMPEFKDSPRKLARILEFINKKLRKKAIYGDRMEKYEKEYQEINWMLTQLQEKENSLPEKKSTAQQSFYWISFAKKSDRELFSRFGNRALFSP
jgi:hypothetical protein